MWDRQEQGSCQALVRAEVGYRSLHDPDMRVTPRVRGQSGMASHHQPHSANPQKEFVDGPKGPQRASITHLGRMHTQMVRMTANFTVLYYTVLYNRDATVNWPIKNANRNITKSVDRTLTQTRDGTRWRRTQKGEESTDAPAAHCPRCLKYWKIIINIL